MTQMTIERRKSGLFGADPGTSTEEEFEGADYKIDQTTDSSLSFSLVCWPLLLLSFIFIVINLTLYTLIRQYVIFAEFLFQTKSKRKKIDWLESAPSYSEYQARALKLDSHLGTERWKKAFPQKVNTKLLIALTKKMKRNSDKPAKLLNILKHASCKPDVGGIEAEHLYSNSFIGTSYIVQEYVDTVSESLKIINHSHLPGQIKKDFFTDAYDEYGRTALCLSGGAQLAYGHLGVVKALFDAGMLPKIITGSSAGCVAAALIATRTDEELKSGLISEDLSQNIKALNDNWSTRLKRLYEHGTLVFNLL